MTATEIQSNFPADIDAILYFERLRWGEKVKCAYCGTERVSQRQNDLRYHCSQCRRTFSVTTGTRIHSSKLPLKIWLQAFSYLSTSKDKIQVRKLQQELNVSYSTAWNIRYDIMGILDRELADVPPENLFESLCKKVLTANYS
jgi:transposase-like protein